MSQHDRFLFLLVLVAVVVLLGFIAYVGVLIRRGDLTERHLQEAGNFVVTVALMAMGVVGTIIYFAIYEGTR